MSYTARAMAYWNKATAWGHPVATCEELAPGSKEDFAQALRLLSSNSPQDGCRFEIQNLEIESVWAAYLRCPVRTWLEVFGEPARSYEHHDSAPLFPVYVWEYSCTDGSLECVGYQVEDQYGDRWITFVRLCHLESDNPP
jgi:hypothetical protein